MTKLLSMQFSPVSAPHSRTLSACYAKALHSLHSVYCTNPVHTIQYVWISKTHLRHVSQQVCHLQGKQCAVFKTNCH
jgi:hypothetical protein